MINANRNDVFLDLACGQGIVWWRYATITEDPNITISGGDKISMKYIGTFVA